MAAHGRRPNGAGFRFWARYLSISLFARPQTMDVRWSRPNLTAFMRFITSRLPARSGPRLPPARQAGLRLALSLSERNGGASLHRSENAGWPSRLCRAEFRDTRHSQLFLQSIREHAVRIFGRF